jgi:hypothetical protein
MAENLCFSLSFFLSVVGWDVARNGKSWNYQAKSMHDGGDTPLTNKGSGKQPSRERRQHHTQEEAQDKIKSERNDIRAKRGAMHSLRCFSL